MLYRLGKKAPQHLARLPMLAQYTVSLPAPPAEVNWSTKVQNLGMFDNDNLGDCTCCSAAHLIQLWTSLTGSQVTPTTQEVVSMYEAACGYNPADPATDEGGIETAVLRWWMQNPLSGHKLDAFAAVQPKSHNDVMDAIWLFGGAYAGISLPISAQNQDVWDVPVTGLQHGDGVPGSWGGHAVVFCGYSARGVLISTWDMLKWATWGFVQAYCDELYAPLSHDWIGKSGLAPSGFDFAALQRDMSALDG